jgi:hypothetical protein
MDFLAQLLGTDYAHFVISQVHYEKKIARIHE